MELTHKGRISEPLLDPELVQVERTVCAPAEHPLDTPLRG